MGALGFTSRSEPHLEHSSTAIINRRSRMATGGVPSQFICEAPRSKSLNVALRVGWKSSGDDR